MKPPVCRLCHKEHWGNCAGVTPTVGAPRVETDPSILRRQVADKPPPPRPRLFEPKPRGVVLVPKRPETSPQLAAPPVAPCSECALHATKIAALEEDAIRYRNKIAALEADLKTALHRGKKTPLSSTERSRRARERKANRAHVAPPTR